jgi:hypothetical protein
LGSDDHFESANNYNNDTKDDDEFFGANDNELKTGGSNSIKSNIASTGKGKKQPEKNNKIDNPTNYPQTRSRAKTENKNDESKKSVKIVEGKKILNNKK